MAIRSLDLETSLTPGCDLWIVSEAARSKWARKIDWYLNFQILRASLHESKTISPDLQGVMDKWDFEAPDVGAGPEAPLMIASYRLLPNKQTVVVEHGETQDHELWVQTCHRVWKQLGTPKIRIFLPDSVPANSFVRAWPKEDHGADVEIVTDGERSN